jgi:serine/threonine protein kinase
LKGKISYMSPEQAKGAPVDRRSDIFSLGIVLWEMVTTHRLFKADNDLATIQMIINSKPQRPSQLCPECPAELERIVLRALSPDPATRYQTAEELQLDLEELAREARLKQSPVALRGFVQQLFEAELRAWHEAQASGATLIDHVTLSTTDMTTPVSESELEYVDDEELDGDDEEISTVEPLPPQQGAVDARPTVQMVAAEMPTVQLGRVDHTPVPSQFPVAPLAWRPGPAAPPRDELDRGRRQRRIAIAVAIGFAVLVLAVLMVGPAP